jgi:hypothetical protein
MRISRVLAVVMAAAALPGGAQAATFCVNTAAGLRAAMQTARTNGQTDTIQIVQGTYVVTGPTGRFLHDGNESVRVEGGYVTGCGSRVVNPANTVLDGNLIFPPLELFSNVAVSHSVDGVTVQNGRNVGTPASNNGGLWSWNPGGTFVLTNSILTGNRASQDGGGLYLGLHVSATLINNTITNNIAGFGGGVYSYQVTNLTLQNNTINSNTANYSSPPGDGGGVYVDAADPAKKWVISLSGNTFVGNTSVQTGGAMYVYTGTGGTLSTFLLTGNTFITNASGSGGAVGMGGPFEFRAERNTFEGNTASSNGGALGIFTVDLVTISSNLFRNNTAANNGGGLYFIEFPLDPFRPTNNVVSVTNNTLVGNQATAQFGGGIWLRIKDDSDVANVYNNIFSANTAPGSGAAADIAIDDDGNTNGVHAPVNLQDNNFNHAVSGFFIYPGFVIPPSNLNNVNPLFVSPGTGNYRLQAGSACRNSGNNGAPGLPAYDRDASFRLAEVTVDMGAYEFGALPFHRRHIVDFEGDLRADIATYHASSSLWFVRNWYTGNTTTYSFGGPGYEAVAGDYDGDGRTDTAVYHPGSGFWFVRFSSTGTDFSLAFGGSGYTAVPDDYDGDGATDLAVYHAASGTWFVRQSSTGTTLTVGFGGTGYSPVREDYDGDGKTDIAVFHPASGLWFVRQSTTGTTLTVGYGGSAYTPVPRDYDGDGRADIAVYHASSGLWFLRHSMNLATQTIGFGGSAYTPVPGYYDPDGRADVTVYDPASGLWFVRQSQTGTTFTVGFGGAGYVPVR